MTASFAMAAGPVGIVAAGHGIIFHVNESELSIHHDSDSRLMADELIQTLDRIALGELSHPDCLSFIPPPLQAGLSPQLQPQHIPRYLFRLSTPKSDGTTSEDWVKFKDASAALLHQPDGIPRIPLIRLVGLVNLWSSE